MGVKDGPRLPLATWPLDWVCVRYSGLRENSVRSVLCACVRLHASVLLTHTGSHVCAVHCAQSATLFTSSITKGPVVTRG